MFLRAIGVVTLLTAVALRPVPVIQFLAFDDAFSHTASRILIWAVWVCLIVSSICLIAFRRQIVAHKHRIAALGISVSLTTVLIGQFMILFYPFDWNSAFVDDSELQHVVIPSRHYRLPAPDYKNLTELAERRSASTNSVTTNEYGFPGVISRTTKRIVLLGDSFTEGAYLHPNFATVLQSTISAHYSDDIDVINFGLGSYSPLIEFNVLKDYVVPLHPNVVILSLDMTDVHDDYIYGRQLIPHESGHYTFEVKTPPILQSGVGRSIYFNAKLFAGILDSSYDVARAGAKSIVHAAVNGKVETARIAAAALDWSIKEKVAYKRSLSGNIESDPVYAYSYKDQNEFLRHLQYTFANITRISQLARDNNITFLLHIYPHSVQIDTGYDCYRDSIGLDHGVLYSDKLLDETSRFASESNITLISSVAALKSSRTKPYYDCDMHFNQTGHEIAAGVIYSALVEQGLLDKMRQGR